MQYFQFTEKEYQALIERLDALNEKISGTQKNPKEIIYDNAELMQLLHVSRRTLQGWRDSGKIAFSAIGGKLYYSMADVQAMLDKHRKDSFA